MTGTAAISRSDAKRTRSAYARHAAVLCVFLFAMGFPGNLANFFGGSSVSLLLQYALFVFQIIFMLLTSGDTFMDMKLVDLHKEYTPIYFMLAVFFIDSMAVTIDIPSQLISCLRFSVTGLFAMWVVQWYDVKHVLTFTYLAQTIIVLLCLMFLVLPGGWEQANGERCFVGIFPTKNVCGAEMAFGITMQVALLRIYWREDKQPSLLFYLLILLQLFILVLCKALGSLITCFVPISVLLMTRGKNDTKRRIPLGWMCILGSVGFMVFALTLMPLVAPLLESMGKDATLTGRIPMWQRHVENMLANHTFTGYGYCMFWNTPEAVESFHAAFDRNSWAASMTTGAHNELIELWLDVGLVGILAHFVMLYFSFRRSKLLSEEAYVFCLAVMLPLFIKGLTERTHTTYELWTLYQFLACGLALKSKAPKPQPRLRAVQTRKED